MPYQQVTSRNQNTFQFFNVPISSNSDQRLYPKNYLNRRNLLNVVILINSEKDSFTLAKYIY